MHIFVRDRHLSEGLHDYCMFYLHSIFEQKLVKAYAEQSDSH